MSAPSPDFAGLRVAALESRMADEMTRMIERLGGKPSVSPSMREVPLENNAEAIDFANRLITGQVDLVILMTGVGVRCLMQQIDRQVPRDRFLSALADTTTLVRGPKPVAVLRELGVTPTYRADEPNTWREVLTKIDQHMSVANMAVTLQEYGQTNPSLTAGLEARGNRPHVGLERPGLLGQIPSIDL